MSGASGGGKLATVDLVTAVTSITNAVAVTSITNPVAVSSIAATVDAKRNIGANITYGSVFVNNASATLLLNADSTRRSIMLRNITAGVVYYIGDNTSVSSTNGMPLEYGETMIIDESATSALYGYQNSGGPKALRYFLETD